VPWTLLLFLTVDEHSLIGRFFVVLCSLFCLFVPSFVCSFFLLFVHSFILLPVISWFMYIYLSCKCVNNVEISQRLNSKMHRYI